MLKTLLPLFSVALCIFPLHAETTLPILSEAPIYCSDQVLDHDILQRGALDGYLYHHFSNPKFYENRHYFIGTRNRPVTAQEYCDFLNDVATDTSWWGIADWFFDRAFMEDSDSWFFNPHDDFPIIRTDMDNTYHYDINSKHGAAIIHCVKSKGVQLKFRAWRYEKERKQEAALQGARQDDS